MEVNVHQAKTHFSELLRRIMGGEEITIARAGVPIARLVPLERAGGRRPLDIDRGVFEVPEDFDAPLPAELIAAFEGKSGQSAKRTGKGRPRRQA